MANWFYTDANGQKVGPITGVTMKILAKQGVITPETIIETEDGKTAPASRVKGLTFAETKPPEIVPPVEAETYDFASLPLSSFTEPNSVFDTLPAEHNPFVAPKVQVWTEPPKPQSPLTQPKVLVPVSVCGGMLLMLLIMLPFTTIFGSNGERVQAGRADKNAQAPQALIDAQATEQDVPVDTLNTIKEVQQAFDRCMGTLASRWNDYMRVGPSLGTAYHRSSSLETTRASGFYNGLDQYMESIRKDIKKLNKSKYENTLKLYAILSQYEKAVNELSGSYKSYTDSLISYREEFTKTLALAELEW